MLPAKSYFKSLDCPCFEIGCCDRPYCLFRHNLKYEQFTNDDREIKLSVGRTVAENSTCEQQEAFIQNADYKPTPISELKNLPALYSLSEKYFDGTKYQSVLDFMFKESSANCQSVVNISNDSPKEIVDVSNDLTLNYLLKNDNSLQVYNSINADQAKRKSSDAQTFSVKKCSTKNKRKLKIEDQKPSQTKSKNAKIKDKWAKAQKTCIRYKDKIVVDKNRSRKKSQNRAENEQQVQIECVLISSEDESDSYNNKVLYSNFVGKEKEIKKRVLCKPDPLSNDNATSFVSKKKESESDSMVHFYLESETLKLDNRIERKIIKRTAKVTALQRPENKIKRRIEMMTPAKRLLTMANIRDREVNDSKPRDREVNDGKSRDRKINDGKSQQYDQTVKIRSVPNVKSLLKEKEELMKKIEIYRKTKDNL